MEGKLHSRSEMICGGESLFDVSNDIMRVGGGGGGGGGAACSL